MHIEDRIIQQDFTNQHFDISRYENIAFEGCQFSHIEQIDFTDCMFVNCNLSNVKFSNCKLDNVLFQDCKMVGCNFTQAKDFAFEIHCDNCMLDYASLDKVKMNKSTFKQCKMHEMNCTQTDFSKAKLTECDFQGTLFSKTNLTGVDMRSCSNFLIDPTDNFIKKAKFRSQDLANLLYRFDIVIS